MDEGVLNILIADNDSAFSECIKIGLIDRDVAVFYADTMISVVNKIQRIHLDLVVVDLNSECFDSTVIYEKAKEMDSECMVFYSMQGDDFALLQSEPKYFPDDIIIKPCHPHELFLKAQLVYRYKYKSLRSSESLVPVCAHCKKVRDDDGYGAGKGSWLPVDQFINEKFGVFVTHSICPSCVKELV